MEENNCIFCKIAKKQINSDIVFEDDNFMCFLDINPKSFCHCLVIPKKHYPDIYSYEEINGKTILDPIKKICLIIKTKFKCDGINIVQNNGKIAGQIINHLHFHIIPRFIEKPKINKTDFKNILRKLKKS